MRIRPIVSSCDSPTENISKFLDYWLQPLMRTLPSFLQNTSQLINDLKELYIPDDSWLVTDPFTPPSHTKKEWKHAEVLFFLQKKPTWTNHHYTLMETVLQNNTFQFNNTAFRQLTGTAMGTSMSTAYANIFMGQLEERILAEAPLEIILYKRYIDNYHQHANTTR